MPEPGQPPMVSITVQGGTSFTAKGKPAYKRWTREETKDLLRGVQRHGVGKWTRILNDPDFQTAEKLRDHFRRLQKKGEIVVRQIGASPSSRVWVLTE